MHPAATVHKILAAVAVNKREFGTLSVIMPPIIEATIRTASTTDLSSVVFGNKKENSLWIDEGHQALLLVESLVLDTHFVSCDTLHGQNSLLFGQEKCARG